MFAVNGDFLSGLFTSIQNEKGFLSFGHGFSCNSNFLVSCGTKIEIGANVLLGWNVTIIDGDGHKILNSRGDRINQGKPIHIGDHVWIASDSTILKGSTISKDSVIGTKSLVTKQHETEKVIIAGNPAQVTKENITWEK